MTMTGRVCRAQVVVGVLGVVVGVWAFVMARNVAFTARVAPRIGWTYLELNFMSFNRLGALLILGFSLVGLIAGALRRPTIGWIPASAFALLVIQVLVQWRPQGTNWFGTNGPALAFGLLASVGYAVTAAAAGQAAQFDEAPAGTPPGTGSEST